MNYKAAKDKFISVLNERLPKTLYYHGAHHAIHVKNYVEYLCNKESLPEYETTLIKTAALAHDLGFIVSYTDNEKFACIEIKKMLPQFNYSEVEVSLICKMIMATKMPQKPECRLSEILCDADLFYLGTSAYKRQSQQLRKEMSEHGLEFTDTEWIKLQINFLEGHEYFTKTASEELTDIKNRVLTKLKSLLEGNS